MDISPVEIQRKEFKRSFRGYNEEEVKDYLEKISQNYESTYKENQDLKEQINMLKDSLQDYKDMESTLKNAIVLAEKAAEDVRKNAHRERDIILKEAMLKANKLLEKSQQKCRLLNEQSEELRRQFSLYKIRFVNFLESQLDFVNSCELNLSDDSFELDDVIDEAAVSIDCEEESEINYKTQTDKNENLESSTAIQTDDSE
jgi:cell division initiation protein